VKQLAIGALACLSFTGCATYNYAESVKTVAFSDDVKKGASVGNIRGEDCTWALLGYKLGGDPTLDRAFINAKNQAGGMESAGFGDVTDKTKARGESLRYVNNVHTSRDGFNAGVVAKNCVVVTGIGYK
jgi:hypothetical protein